MSHWILFTVPCPTPLGKTSQDLLDNRTARIDDNMRASARAHGCRFHRAFVAEDGTAFCALACWEAL